MAEPRRTEQVDQTLLPGSESESSLAAPNDTVSHGIEATILPPVSDPGPHSPTPAAPPVAPAQPAFEATLVPGTESTRLPGVEPTLVPGAQPTLFPGVEATFIPGVEATRLPEGSAHPTSLDATLIPTPAGETRPDKTVSPDATVRNSGRKAFGPAVSGPVVGRFALRGLHAKGGLGEVFTARDTELNREVALKRIQARFADDPSSRRRFLSEAEITAKLDHPGVVPVFGLVSDGFGRPCYAMRFIRGETLKDEIDRYHGIPKKDAKDKPEPAPAPATDARTQPRSVAFRHLLQRFIAVCQAIAYAHTHKVIHRDIKPANVMVGTFGETLVVDWGLAKALDDGVEHENSPAPGGKTMDADLADSVTIAGTAVGTPAYMPPEQANGRLDLLGPGADIYSLGATLYVILAGKPPFSGGASETLEKVRRGDFQPPLVVNSQVPRPLDAVCRKAMSLKIEDRYGTAMELAADVERWLSDEPVSCYPDPLFARMARWARRHPARIATAISLLLAGIIGAGGVAFAIYLFEQQTLGAYKKLQDEEAKTRAEKDRAEDETKKKQDALIKLDLEKKQTENQRADAVRARDAAVDTYNTLVFDIQRQLADRAGTQQMRRKLLMKAVDGLNDLFRNRDHNVYGVDRTLVMAHRQIGDVYRALGNTHEARREYDIALPMAISVQVNALENHEDEAAWAATQELGLVYLRLAGVHLEVGDTAGAESKCKEALELFTKALQQRPADRIARENLAATRDQFGDVLIERGANAAAEEQCRQALNIRERLRAESDRFSKFALFSMLGADTTARRQVADSLDQLAEILVHRGKTTEAREKSERCLAIRQDVIKDAPRLPEAVCDLAASHARLGEIALERGDLKEARIHFADARQKLKDFIEVDSHSAGANEALARVLGRLAEVALRTGDLDTALHDADACLALSVRDDDDDPDSTRTTRDLADSHARLGDILLARGDKTVALIHFYKGVEFLRPLLKNDRESVQLKRALVHGLDRLGTGLLASDNPSAAVKFLKESVELRRELRKVDESCVRAKAELALGLGLLAGGYRAVGDYRSAHDSIVRQLELLRELIGDDKNSPTRLELARVEGNWADLLAETEAPTAALVAAQQSLDLITNLAGAGENNPAIQAERAAALERLAAIYAQAGQDKRAVPTAQKAQKLRDKLADDAGNTMASRRDRALAMIRLADIYAAVCQFSTAEDWYKKARNLVAAYKDDPVTAPAARLVEEKLALLGAINVLIEDPIHGLSRVPLPLQVPALRSAVEWLVIAKRVVLGSELAKTLAAKSETRQDLYRAAYALARCSTLDGLSEKVQNDYASEAVKVLKLTVDLGFHDMDLISGPEWEACRKLPAFKDVLKKIAEAKLKTPSK